jgi:hypothetical protein
MWVRLPTQIQWQSSNWRSNETGKKISGKAASVNNAPDIARIPLGTSAGLETFAHFAVSSVTNFAKFTGELASGVPPSSISRDRRAPR